MLLRPISRLRRSCSAGDLGESMATAVEVGRRAFRTGVSWTSRRSSPLSFDVSASRDRSPGRDFPPRLPSRPAGPLPSRPRRRPTGPRHLLAMRRKLAPLLALIVGAMAFAPPLSAGAVEKRFSVFCEFSHRGAVDPIVNPGPRGTRSAHQHVFYGNRTTDSDSTYAARRGNVVRAAGRHGQLLGPEPRRPRRHPRPGGGGLRLLPVPGTARRGADPAVPEGSQDHLRRLPLPLRQRPR